MDRQSNRLDKDRWWNKLCQKENGFQLCDDLFIFISLFKAEENTFLPNI